MAVSAAYQPSVADVALGSEKLHLIVEQECVKGGFGKLWRRSLTGQVREMTGKISVVFISWLIGLNFCISNLVSSLNLTQLCLF